MTSPPSEYPGVIVRGNTSAHRRRAREHPSIRVDASSSEPARSVAGHERWLRRRPGEPSNRYRGRIPSRCAPATDQPAGNTSDRLEEVARTVLVRHPPLLRANEGDVAAMPALRARYLP